MAVSQSQQENIQEKGGTTNLQNLNQKASRLIRKEVRLIQNYQNDF